MPADIEATDQLAQHVAGLDPEQVEAELGSLLEVQAGRRTSLLGDTVDANDIGESLGVLGAMEGAIAKVEGSEVRGALGNMVTGTLVRSLRDGAFRGPHLEASISLASAAFQFNRFVDDPEAQATSAMRISEQMARRIGDYSDVAAAAKLASTANTFLSSASNSARRIADPSERALILMRLSETGAENLARSQGMIDELSPQVREERRALRAIHGFPKKLYGDALLSAKELPSAADSLSRRTQIVLSMAKSVGKIRNSGANRNVAIDLAVSATTEIDAIRDTYGQDGELSSLSPVKKARGLARLGGNLAQIFDMDLKHNESESDDQARGLFVDATVNIFKDSLEYAQSTRLPKWLRSALPQHRRPGGMAYNAAVAAGRLLKSDPEHAKELFEIGFKLGVVEDSYEKPGTHVASNQVADGIAERAKEQGSVKEAFELFSLAHGLESERAGDGVSPMLRENARQALQFLVHVVPQREVAIEEIDRGLVSLMIGIAGTHTDPYFLTNLGHHIKDPGLREAMDSNIENLKVQKRKQSVPQTESARLAQEAIRHPG